MRFKRHAIAVLPALLVAVTTAIAQPKPSPAPQALPSLNTQQQQELQQLREEKRLHELIKKDLEDSKVIGDRVQAEVDRAFGRMMNWLNALLVVLTLFPILTVLGFWLLRRSILSESLSEITKSGEEIKREAAKQSSTAKEEIEQVTSKTKTQLEGMVSEAKGVLQSLREQIAIAQEELDNLRTETKSQIQEAFSEVQRKKDQILQELSEITPLPSPSPQIVSPEVQQKIQELTEQLAALKASNPQLLLTENDYVKQGDAFFSEGRYEEAVLSYDKALELKPNFREAWRNRGLALGGYLKQYVAAIAAYDKALDLNPDDYEVWNNRGVALAQLKQYIAAIASYDKALEFKSDSDLAQYNKACCYGLQGKVELAIEQLREAINFNADWGERAKTDADFDAIQEDERFKQLLEG